MSESKDKSNNIFSRFAHYDIVTQSTWPELHHSIEAEEGDIVWGVIEKISKRTPIRTVKMWNLSRKTNNTEVHTLDVENVNDTVEELSVDILSPLHDMILDGSKKVRVTVEVIDA